VTDYLTDYADLIAAGYSSEGRGIPDISLFGHNYVIVVDGNYAVVDGTSASSPVMAAMISLMNSNRLENGRPTMGWLTPLLYSNASAFVWDITEGGVNNCTAVNGYDNTTYSYLYNCCDEGFPTTPGWDATTGLGSLNVSQFFETFYLPSFAPTMAPTPTLAPSYAPRADDSKDVAVVNGAVAGIVVGTVVVIGTLIALIYYVATHALFPSARSSVTAMTIVATSTAPSKFSNADNSRVTELQL
jgi:subtilase family serine protease